MIIRDDKQIKAVQKEFNEKFPYLKIEFYKKRHAVGQGSPSAEKLEDIKTIGDARLTHIEGDLSINGHLKVSTLEEMFHKNYGLNVQVFRKSGNLWLQTTSTDDWTLSEQNNRAQEEFSSTS